MAQWSPIEDLSSNPNILEPDAVVSVPRIPALLKRDGRQRKENPDTLWPASLLYSAVNMRLWDESPPTSFT